MTLMIVVIAVIRIKLMPVIYLVGLMREMMA